MSIRHLDQLFDPASVAAFGASQRPASVGAKVWANMRGGGFKGPVYAVNPKHREFDAQAVFARAADLPTVPELAVICTPPSMVAGLIGELGALGTRATVVLTAGLDAEQKKVMLAAGAKNFAIRPYPAQLVEAITWQGRKLTLRPIRPEDEARHLELLGSLDPAAVRMRVFYSRRSIERSELARLTQIDYEREMAIVAVARGPDGADQTLGVARAMADPGNLDAEFGIIVRPELKGTGLGSVLMHKLIRTLREHGTQRLLATVLVEDQRTLALAKSLGFLQRRPAVIDGATDISLMLQPAAAGADAALL